VMALTDTQVRQLRAKLNGRVKTRKAFLSDRTMELGQFLNAENRNPGFTTACAPILPRA
jgi:hypothetical protein